MNIEQMIEMCRARLSNLGQIRASAVALGDIAQVASLDAQIAETQTALNNLLTLGD
jgi:hypothetical protein